MPICEHCGFEPEAGAGSCPLCGTRLATERAEPGSAETPAWEQSDRPIAQRFLQTWKRSLFRPGEFYRGLLPDAPLAPPLLYYLLATVTGAFFTLWWEAAGVVPSVGRAELDTVVGGAVGALLGFFLSPFVALTGLAVWTGIVHLFVLLLAPDRRAVGATARVLCYAGGPAVLSIVPLLGTLVASVWTIVLQVIGVRELHRTTTGRAALVVLLPIGLLIAAGIALVLLLVSLLGAALLELYV